MIKGRQTYSFVGGFFTQGEAFGALISQARIYNSYVSGWLLLIIYKLISPFTCHAFSISDLVDCSVYNFISCFSHKFAAHISINLRGIFKNQERILFITDSFKTTSHIFCTGVQDREIGRRLWDPNFQKFAKLPQIRYVFFGLIVFKYFELSCN